MLPFATLSDLETGVISGRYADKIPDRELEREHSAPANDEILSEGFNWWQCQQPGSTPTQTVLPIVPVAKLVLQKIANYQGPLGGRRLCHASHNLIVAKQLGFMGTGVAFVSLIGI